jgi:PAS domain S-box-containing protein
MKQKTLIGEVRRNQFANIIILGLLILILILMGYLAWNQTNTNIKERLLTLDKILELTFKEHQSLIIECFKNGDIIKARDLVEGRFQDIIRCYPQKLTAGFYFRDLGRVIVIISNYDAENLYNYVLPSDDPAPKTWQIRHPQYSFLWSSARRTWLLMCDYPVIADGNIIGYTFANIDLAALILLYCQNGLAVMFIAIIAGYLSFIILLRDRMNAQKIIKKTTQKLAGIVETSADAIISMSLDGKITGWNQGAIKLYGYTAEEVLGKSFLLTIPTESHECMRDGLIKLKQGQVFEDNCAVGIRKNGSRIYVSIKSSLIKDNAGNIVEFSSIHRDITELIIFEEALAKERELLMVTLNSLTEGVIATDAEDRIFLFNDAAVSLTGYSQMEAVDEPLDKILFIIDDKTSEPVTYITSQTTNRVQKMPRNLILVTRNLKEIPISAHSSPIKSSNSTCSIIGAVTVFQDITEKQKTEQELYRADKLESLGILAGGIAHDFNNILAAILSNIQLAQMKYNKNQDIEKYLQESIESTYRASELTRQLLTFSKGGAPVKKAASLAELIDDTAKFALRGSKVKVSCKISKTLWPVEVDTGQISQVIYNLVINAKQAMPRGGIIEISAENMVNEYGNRFNPGNYVKIAVKDQGIGIPMENLTKIFDPFFTTKNEGSGLGLTTSYSIIKQHDGYLEVESEVGMGTTFFIYLPASLQPLILSDIKKEVSLFIEKLKILLMDDEVSVLKSVGEMLEFYGHQAILTVDGSEAVKEYRKALEESAPFDVVIMDLTVPGGIGGQEAITHLQRIDPNVKAIVSSGYANDPIIADYERFGFSGVVTKPYKFDELNRVLNRVMGSKQLRLELDYKYEKDNLRTMNG